MSDEMPPCRMPPRVKRSFSWGSLRHIVDHNPCFLLSAVCMFLGCYLLDAALDVRAADIAKAILLLATINLYEFALIALGIALLRKPGGRGRDGVLLLGVQLLFLADAPFLIAQLVQVSVGFGWIIALALGVLAIVKAAVVLRGAGIPFRGRTVGFLALQVFLIYGLPVVMSRMAVGGELSARALYGVWWVVGMLPLAYDLLARFERLAPCSGRQGLVRRAMLVIPWLLLVAHVGFFHYIYRAEFVVSDLSPVLLGLAVLAARLAPSAFLPANQLRILRYALPAIALLLALAGGDLGMVLPYTSHAVSPAMITGAAALVLYGYFISPAMAFASMVVVVLAATGWLCSAGISAMGHAYMVVARRAGNFGLSLVPTSTAAWGVLAVVTAFLLLGAGALWSLRGGPGERSSS